MPNFVADSVEATGLKWAAPASGGITEIATGTLSGSSVVISSIPATYKNLQLVLRGAYTSDDAYPIYLRVNNDSNANRHTIFRNSSGSNVAFDQTRGAITANQDNTTGTGALTIVDFPDYANTSTWKLIVSNSSITIGDTSTQANMQPTILGAYNQTGAISSLGLLPDSGTFSGGTYILYGVK